MGQFFVSYFLLSSVMTAVVYWMTKRTRKELSLFETVVYFFFSPVIVGILEIQQWLFPSSGDPIDIVYTKLSFSEWKTGEEIALEIQMAGQRVGGSVSEERAAKSLLEIMVDLEYAKRGERTITGPRITNPKPPEIVYRRGLPPPKGGKWKRWFVPRLRLAQM